MAGKEATLLLRIKSAGGEILDKISGSFDAIKQAGMIAFAAVTAVVLKSIDAYREQEEANNSLAQSMVNAGIYSAELSKKYQDQAAALMKLTTFGDEQIVNAQSVLQRFLGQTEVTEELTKATLNLATAKKMDLASAAELVGKSIGTSTNALARNGIEVTANADKQQKLSEVIGGLNKQFGGQAEAAAQGYGGITQLNNIMGELFESIGEKIQPVIMFFVKGLKEIFTDTENVTAAVDGFAFTLTALTKAGIIVTAVIEAIANTVVNLVIGLGAVGAAIVELVSGNFRKAANLATAAGEQIVAGVVDAKAKGDARLKALDDEFDAQQVARAEKRINDARTSKQNEAAVRAEETAKQNSVELEALIAQQELEMQVLAASEEQKRMIQLNARIKAQEQILKSTTDAHAKLAAQQEIFRLNEEKKDLIAAETKKKNMESTLNTIATLQSSSNATLAGIGKAAAITEIAIQTPVAIARALAAFPPPFNFAAAGLVGAAMAAQAANIAGVKLADGGVVMPRPGGTQAIIGEAGQAEAVIPLDRFGDFGLGGGGNNITIVVNGGLLGSPSEAREFAVAIDKELLKLEQNGERLS